jgi:putative SOS response-associated peptidase YedK
MRDEAFRPDLAIHTFGGEGVRHGFRRGLDCTMIIASPNKFVAEVHDRMPVLLAEKDFEPWLGGAAGAELLKPAPEEMLQRWPVSKRVNSSKAPAEDPTLIEPINVA